MGLLECMKQLVLQLQAHPTFAKVWHWVKLIAITGGAQAVVQATGLLSGILIIRLLPVEEYALYTLANTMLGTMTVLADGGISTGVMAEGGKVWQDKEKLGIVIATGLDLRRKFAIGSLVVSIPILVYLLRDHGASWLMTVLIIISLIPAFFAALSDSLLQVAPKLHQEIVPLQKNQMTVSTIRLLLSGLMLFIFPWTFVSLLANALPRIYGNIQLRQIVRRFIEDVDKPCQEVRQNILKTVYRILPGSIYYCLSGQITVLLLSFWGTTSSVAQVGALGRVSTLINLVSVILSLIVVPQFSRLPFVKVKVFFWKTTLVITLFFFVIFLGVNIFANYILLILGNLYSDFGEELILLTSANIFNITSGLYFSISTVRGKPTNPYFLIICNLFSNLFFVIFYDVSTLKGVLFVSLWVSLFTMFVNFIGSYFAVFYGEQKN